MQWERLALRCAILIPPLALLALVGLMALEANHNLLTRVALCFLVRNFRLGGLCFLFCFFALPFEVAVYCLAWWVAILS